MEDELEVRFEVGLPAAGRKILEKPLHTFFMDMFPDIAEKALLYRNLDQKALKEQVVLILDQVHIQEELAREIWSLS